MSEEPPNSDPIKRHVAGTARKWGESFSYVEKIKTKLYENRTRDTYHVDSFCIPVSFSVKCDPLGECFPIASSDFIAPYCIISVGLS
jgi:hypothetical protein